MKFILLTLLVAAPALLVSGESVITCDGDVQHLYCDTGVIMVKSTVYGRTDGTVCSTPPHPLKITDTSCSLSISTIADRCNGLRKCDVRTDSLGTSDPCKGTYKYYQTTYDCINGRVAVVCEHGYRTLDCGSDLIKIINANFGRADSVTCTKGRYEDSLPKTNCYAPDTNSAVATLCNKQNKCTVEASSTIFSPLSGPCKETSKYLTVSYTCYQPPPPPPPKSMAICENAQYTLKCDAGHIIIQMANYGRLDTTTCSTQAAPSEISNKNCKSDEKAIVSNSCDGKTSCLLSGFMPGFTDNCPDTRKYLFLLYICVE